jgi:hypothetical protein
LREEIGAPLSPRVQSDNDVNVDAARRAMGDDVAFESAWAEGRSMTLDQVRREMLDS